jgi:hypothetical protein
MISQQRRVHLFAGVGLLLIVAALVVLPLSAVAQEATPEAAPLETPEVTQIAEPIYDLGAPPVEPTGDNSYCLVCHSQPWRVATLGDGTQLNIYVNHRTILNSVHGEGSDGGPLGCVDCHGNNFPHGPTPETAREYALEAVNACVGCHANEARDLQLGLHEQAIMAGNLNAAVCTDCHGAHDVQAVVEQADLIAGVCGDCHLNSYAEWRVSAHVDLGPLGCATCHSPHTQMIRGGNTANELCMGCHGETMPEIWVHNQHLIDETGVGCVDCHMNPLTQPVDGQAIPVSIEDRSTGHSMHVGTVACTTCHAEQPVQNQPVTVIEAEPIGVPQGETAQEPINAVALVQGLLLGLGIGATAAAIIVARGNKKHE